MIKKNRFVQECIKTYLGNPSDLKLKKAFSKLSHDQINRIILNHSLGGLMHYLYLNNHFNNCSVDDLHKKMWKNSAWEKSLSNTINDSEAVKFAKLLTSEGISYSYIKGAVCRKYYPIDYIRSSADIDFFISQSDYMSAKKILLNNGYVIPYEHYKKSGISIPMEDYEKIADEIMFIKNIGATQYIVDLQWNMISFDESSIFNEIYAINKIILSAENYEFLVEGYPIKTLPIKQELLIMVFHFTFHHGFRGLKWMIDIFTYIKNCDMSPDELIINLSEDNKKLIGIMYMIASEYTDLLPLTKAQKKTMCVDRFLPLELGFYKNLLYKTNMGVMQSIEHRIVKAILPYRIITKIKAFGYLLFNPLSINHRIQAGNNKCKLMQPFKLILIAINDSILNRKKSNEKSN